MHRKVADIGGTYALRVSGNRRRVTRVILAAEVTR